jgi:hypothetical protein
VRGPPRLQRCCDHLQHAIHILHDVVVPKSQYTIVVILQPPSALATVLIVIVLPTIGLDDEALLATDEIDDVGADRLLADEFMAVELARSQPILQSQLGLR